MENNGTKTLEYLDIFLCGFLDFPKSGVDCSKKYPEICFKCEIRGGYLTGESINTFGGGHWTCRVVWYLTLLVALVGIFANLSIVLIIRSRKSERSFDFLLCLLALVDFLVCLTTLASATAPVAYFENWYGRGKGTMYWIQASSLTMLLWRSISIFVTLLITIERYLVIAYPIRSICWFSKTKTRLQALFVVTFGIVISVPRYSSLYVGKNIYRDLDVPGLRDLEYIYLKTRLYNFWKETFHGAHDQVEYWIPIPLLLLFNYLSYRKVKQLCQKRQQMNCTQRQELQAARMFIPVTVLLLCCNFWPTFAFVIMHFWGVFHREMYMTWSLTIALNSTANFWIYYFRGNTFKAEARLLFSQLVNKFTDLMCRQWGEPQMERENSFWSSTSAQQQQQRSRSATITTTPKCLAGDRQLSVRR